MTSSAWVPMDPVDPKMAMRFFVVSCSCVYGVFMSGSIRYSLQKFVGYGPVVSQPRHLILSTQLTLRSHIINKSIPWQLHKLQCAEYTPADQIVVVGI